jgi:excisionase family DNA binding protein
MRTRTHTSDTLEERFWSMVKKGDGCWEWQGPRRGTGYGTITVDGKARGAHRVSFMLAYGDILGSVQIMHKCDNPPCVRPDHLSIGTAQDNSRDKVAKGRQRGGMPKSSVADADRLLAPTQIAMLLGVSRQTVYNMIKDGRLTPAMFIGKHPIFNRTDVEAIKAQG